MLRKLFTMLVCLMAAITTASAQTPPYNEIWYTTTNGKAPEFFKDRYFAPLSTYTNGKGVIKFDDSIDINYIISNAFKGCSKLTSINIGKGVTEIGKEAFSGCYNLKSITIPKTARLDPVAFAYSSIRITRK